MGTIGAVGVVVVGAVWEARKDYVDELKSDIASRKEAATWNVPETIKNLNAASEKVAKQLATMESVEALKSKNKDLEESSAKLSSDLKKTAEELLYQRQRADGLSKELSAIVSPVIEFTLENGETEELIKNRVTLGVHTVYPSSVSFTVNNRQYSLQAGNNESFTMYGKDCLLTLSKLAYPKASFKFSCSQPRSGA